MTVDTSTGSLYRWAAASWIEMAREVSGPDWQTPVPCTPGWTVRDVLSHVSGIPDDALAGRMDGVATPPWTADQVERNRHASVEELIERWEEQIPVFADFLDRLGEGRPPFDCHSHEHDVRHALGRPGNRESVIVESAGRDLARFEIPGVAMRVEFTDGVVVSSGEPGGRPLTLGGVTPFELFRSRTGRRSRDQVRGADWDGADADIEAVLDRWFLFGPATRPIIE